MSTPADRTMEPTPDNWGTINKLYASQIGTFMKEGQRRSDAMAHASQVIGLQMTPPMSPEDFRSYIASGLSRLRNQNSRKPAKRHPRLNSGSLVDELWGGRDTSDLELGPNERCYQLLKGMQKGETRFEVCISEEQARSIQQRVTICTERLRYRKESVSSALLPNVAHQAGERRYLLAVRRS